MRVLVLDTALGACTVAVFEDDQPLAVRLEPMGKGHQERLGGLARDAVNEAGGFERLDRIGVTVGPGSFTGLRVGMAFAQGLGAALGRPVIGVSTLQALARSAAGIEAGATRAAVIDARRGQVYVQLFRGDAALGEPEALAIEGAAARIRAAGPGTVLVGSGAALLSALLPEAATSPLDWPAPQALAALTLEAAALPPGAAPRPLYLRAPDATPPTRLPGQPRP